MNGTEGDEFRDAVYIMALMTFGFIIHPAVGLTVGTTLVLARNLASYLRRHRQK